ncbi:MAG TPA: LPS assembly lipoprotein LptE [Longimicrobiaceae bacterium]|nr:LPS assembly lipoprotein LptE [Longimicrobiaceae bacterium]
MWNRFRKTPGLRLARSASAALAAALLLTGCIYHFTGGGLPSHVRTVFIEQFENDTPYGTLPTDAQRELQESLRRNLGLRLASRENADAVLRGHIRDYREVQANVRPGQEGRIDVNLSEVQIVFDAEIYDVKQDRSLWRGSSVNAIGQYNPARNETVDVARSKAIHEMAQKVIEGAQSQW